MSATQSGVQPVGVQDPNRKIVTWTLVLARTYQLYAQKFWGYFRIALVPAIIAYAFNYFVRTVIRNLTGNGSSIPLLSAKSVAMVVAFQWARGAIYWIISAFFLAAIAATFVRENVEDSPAVADAYTLPRKRLGAIAAVALITWTLFFVGRSLASLALVQLNQIGLIRNYWADYCSSSFMLLLLASLISKFALAIPELVQNPSSSMGSAMKKSLKETENWEVFFAMFLLKSAVIGYGIYWIANRGLHLFWQHTTVSANAYTWIQRSIYIFIAAVIETPLFIAFSVLYRELQAKDEGPDPSAIH